MTEFVGRSAGKRPYSYPDTRPGSNAPPGGNFARNYGSGPTNDTAIAAGPGGTQIPWDAVDVPGVFPTNIPITPKSTGFIMIRGMIGVVNTDSVERNLHVNLQLDGVTIASPADVEVSVPPANGPEETGGFTEIPFIVKVNVPFPSPTVNVQILLTAATAGHLTLTAGNSTLEVEEVALSTG